MDELTAFRILAERLAERGPGWSAFANAPPIQTEVLAARVPGDLPLGVPLPPAAVIIGTIRLWGTEPGPVQQLDVLCDTAWPAAQVQEFYHDRLTQAGWTLQEHTGHMGGFIPPSPTSSFETEIVQGHDGGHLTVIIAPAPAGGTQVELILAVYPADSAWIAGRALRGQLRHLDVGHLPLVRLPAGTRFIAGGGGSGSSTTHAEAGMVVESDLDRAGLVAFMTPQLEQAGWSQQAAGEDGALTWSSWTFVDQRGAPWRGALYVLRCPDPTPAIPAIAVGRVGNPNVTARGAVKRDPASARVPTLTK